MNYNYHAHTTRCGHAAGTEEEYILRAIQNGVTHMGFSDHAPYIFPDGYESYYRVPTAQVEDYFSVLGALREKYRNQIDLKIGFEMEYYPSHFRAMLDRAISWGCEYLILGQHFIGEEHPNGTYTGAVNESEDDLREYVSCVISAMESGVFTYVAHPDIFRFQGSDDAYRREMRKLCRAAREHNVPLEINFLGIRDGRNYPHEPFWAIAGEEQSPVTFGFDSHDAPAAYDGESLARAEELVRKYRLNYIGRPELILLQDT